MNKVKYIVYCKVLYNTNNKEIIVLRKNLAKYYSKGIFLTKKEVENYEIKQYINTFLINIKKETNINDIIIILKKLDYIQLLGIIKNNILIINYINDLKHNIYYTYKLIINIFIIKKITLVPLKNIIKYNKMK